jgi:hypothetical protein
MNRHRLLTTILASGGAAAPTYSISGTVYESDDTTAVQGATITLGSTTATSAADGTYTLSGLAAGASGSMTCTKYGYTWTAISIAAMSGNLTGQNYTTVSYDFPFAALSNGALPAGITGSTWAIASGQAANSPTLGSELLTDGGLEATYTAGLCATLTKSGSPTVAQSADVHAGGSTKAQEYTGTINNDAVNFTAVGSLTGKWIQYSGWGKRTAGTSDKTGIARFGNVFPAGFSQIRNIKDAAYTQKISVGLAYAASQTLYAAINGSTPFDTVVVDDFSMKQITAAEMYATRSYHQADMALKLYLGGLSGNNGTVGIVGRLDSTSNPQNYLLVGVTIGGSLSVPTAEVAYISLAKVVGGTVTVLIASTSLGALVVNNDTLELVCSGNDVSIYYNGTQKGTTQTVSDAGITGNKNCGFFGAGGALVNRFFLAASR